ncbi:poly(A)-specific ribonuclease PARN-like isoform X2 [Dreissena polymorpha]|uniref:poly(A)-specific ribonuclease PARN-like isoform X2 n=1 Tax=Dreissena polymorpha TaxID=45954 RepID=UPI002265072D|nr:poly(A)-specific ribonuclease PARN-like isoform X2 [Dreissena polymorpha]
MDVTKKNFKESLAQIQQAITECNFIAIDGEFTGLNHAGASHCAVFDTPEERYHKLVEGASDFLLIQFGLCTFTFDGETKKYTAKPFNFYIFPRPFSRAAPDIRFTCQSSSLDFLLSQGFDFNKMIGEGISYLRPADEARLKDQVQKKHEVFSSPAFITPGNTSQGGIPKGPVEIPPEMESFVEEICKKVEKFLESGEHETLSLPSVSAFQRKLTYQSLQAKFGTEIHLQAKTGDNRERFIVVTKVKGEEGMKQIEANRQKQDLDEIDDAVGFTHVIKMISQSGKLVVGHNMLLDIAHTIHQFMYPLPTEYQDFKAMCRCVFPRLIDTKLMASTQPFKDKIDNSGLGNLLHITQISPFRKPSIEIAEGMDARYCGTETPHEAGYDACITGQCFISLANHLGDCVKPAVDHVLPGSQLLEPFLNKIFMMRSLDIPYMDLTSPDLNPSRDHVFHISFPVDWKHTDISQLFSPFGNVYIGWLDDTSAYVSLHSKSQTSSVMKSLCKKGSVYRLMTYQEHKDQYKWTPQNTPGTYPGSTPGKTSDGSAPTINSQMTPTQDQYHSEGAKKGAKRTHSPDLEEDAGDGGSSAKKSKPLNVDAPVFQSRLTPTNTPEKDDKLQWPDNINSSEKKIDNFSEPEDHKLFAEPTDW